MHTRANKLRRTLAAAAISLALGHCPDAAAQTNVTFNVAGPATWNLDGNWNPAFVPQASFNEVAVIGASRSVFVDDAPLAVGGIIMDSSTLEIRSGGNLSVVSDTVVAGNIVMGQSVNTNLIVRRGGTLSAQDLTTGGGTGTQITLGETGGAGTSTLSVASGTLNRVTRIVGPNVNFTSSGNLTFSAAQTLAPVITGATHSAINVTGTAFLGGVVRPEISGPVPALGSSWNLVTAGQLSGSFSLNKSLLPATPRGTAFSLSQTATTARLNYSNALILTVDRNTGTTQIQNAIGNPIQFDAYTIASPSGALTGAWNSLQDQAIAAWDEANNSGPSRLTEFKTNGTTSINAGNQLSLGTPFAPAAPASFGVQPGADLSFNYNVPGLGATTGIVEMVGALNNLVLTIDPTTGEAAIQNESPYFDVAIEAYSITSASGKLLTGNAAWNSLQDQGVASWDQADNSSTNRLTEFKTAGSTALAGGGTVLDLGAPITLAAGPLSLSDFSLDFMLSTGESMKGVVKFGPLPTANPNSGDFDDDGDVDGSDFLTWQRALGSAAVPPGSGADGNANGVVDGPDLAVWRGDFGSATVAAGGSVAAVPEPAAWLIAMAGMIAVGAGRSRFAFGGREGGK
jgi:hypothetical protein